MHGMDATMAILCSDAMLSGFAIAKNPAVVAAARVAATALALTTRGCEITMSVGLSSIDMGSTCFVVHLAMF